MLYDQEQIKAIIPHREPFLLVDAIEEMEEGKRAVGILRVDERMLALKGHFPGYPVMPGVLQIEAIAQVGAVAILSMPEYKGKLAMFGGVDKVKFRCQVRPGDTLRMEVELESLRASAGRGHGVATVDGEKACELSMLFILGDRNV